MTRKIRPELPAGTVVKVGKAGWYNILGLEKWTTRAGSRIYIGRHIEYGRESTFSECDITAFDNENLYRKA